MWVHVAILNTTKKALWRYRQLLAKRCLVDFWHHWREYHLVSNAEVYFKFNVESFYLSQSASNLSSLLSQPHLILDALFLRTFCTWSLYGHKSQTPANIFFACSVVRLGLVFKYNCKSTFLQQVGWERCPVFKRTLKSGDVPPLRKRLDRGSLCKASASNLGTDICMIRLLSVFFVLSFLSFPIFHFSAC